jgi:hypothetical protein
MKQYNFKLKGTGPIDFHLGQSFSQNDDGEMEISAKRYVDKMIDTYVQLYGEKPRKASSPLEQNDHPEMDDSPFLGQDETQQFQSLIGAMQWAVLIGSLDRHNALSFHRVREAVASKYVMIFHLLGEYNPADILSKHWAYA